MTQEYILKNIKDWPIQKLATQHHTFIKEVATESTEELLNHYGSGAELRELVAKTLYAERLRMVEDPWQIDPDAEDEFWQDIKSALLDTPVDPSKEDASEHHQRLLQQIVQRYLDEMSSQFSVRAFRLARRMIKGSFHFLLGASDGHFWSSLSHTEKLLRQRIQLHGAIEHTRQLLPQGTLVLMPTHSSNLDAILMAWACDILGLPLFAYGAGRNLYNSPLMAYFYSRLGAYTIDRRRDHPIYNQTLHQYIKHTLMRGVHSLIFPGGTRSRSGQIETNLKHGLLNSLVDAQANLFAAGQTRRIFIVPVSINYPFTLEAKRLIDQYLRRTGKELYLTEREAFGGTRNFLRFVWSFFQKGAQVHLHFGKPMDVLGHTVDTQGQSIDAFGRSIKLADFFKSKGVVCTQTQRDGEYAKLLGQALTKAFYKYQHALCAHVVAHAAFNYIRQRFEELDLYELMRLPSEDRYIPQSILLQYVTSLHTQLKEKAKNQEICLSQTLRSEDSNTVLTLGLKQLDSYHTKKAVKKTRKGTLCCQDLPLLYYYHNRLQGYNLICP